MGFPFFGVYSSSFVFRFLTLLFGSVLYAILSLFCFYVTHKTIFWLVLLCKEINPYSLCHFLYPNKTDELAKYVDAAGIPSPSDRPPAASPSHTLAPADGYFNHLGTGSAYLLIAYPASSHGIPAGFSVSHAGISDALSTCCSV